MVVNLGVCKVFANCLVATSIGVLNELSYLWTIKAWLVLGQIINLLTECMANGKKSCVKEVLI